MNTPLVNIASAIGAFCGFDSYGHRHEAEVKKKSGEVPPPDAKRPSKKERHGPVFAPEFDGLFCYETLIKH